VTRVLSLPLAASLPLLLSACVIGQVGAVIHPTVSGGLLLRDAAGTETRWTPDRCASGDLNYFLGFDFSSSSDSSALRVVKQPIAGATARWLSAQHVATFPSAGCARFDIDVHPTGWRVNEVRELAGYVELQCSADGATIEGRISVDHCH